MIKEVITGIIAVAIIVGAVVGIFYPFTNDIGVRIIESLATLVVGYYFGSKTMPLAGVFGKGK